MKISVITPFYNSISRLGFDRLNNFVHSLVNQQGLKNFRHHVEHVWIDDGSTDDTFSFLERAASEFGSLHVRRLRNEVNEGPGDARNTAVAAARGKWIAYVDSDDLMTPTRISDLRRITGSACDILFAPYWICAGTDVSLYDLKSRLAETGQTIQALAEEVNPSIPLGVCHTHEVWRRAGGFPRYLVCGEDGVLWRRMLNHCHARIGFIETPAGFYAIAPDSQSRTQRAFGSGRSFAMDTSHPKGSNGQYLDGVSDYSPFITPRNQSQETAP